MVPIMSLSRSGRPGPARPARMPGPRAVPALVVLVLLTTALAGCFGGDGKSDTVDPAKEDKDLTGTTPGEVDGNKTDEIEQVDPDKDLEDKDTITPQAHQHHHWGTPAAEQAILFDGTVTLTNDACMPDQMGSQEPPCVSPTEVHVGSVTFTPEEDGDDVETNNEKGINPQNKADAVLSGTSHIVASFTWTDDATTGGLLFYYKAANSPGFKPQGGIPVQKDSPIIIQLDRPGMSDPAHQVSVSKWKFRLVAGGSPVSENSPIMTASGDVAVEIIINNGGESSIDPPHPNPWGGLPSLSLGKTTGSSTTLVAASVPAYQDGARDIRIPAPHVVPLGTEKLIVTAWVNATDANQQTLLDTIGWGLMYHGADKLEYVHAPDPSDGDAGAKVFEIPLTAIEWDPPYEKESYYGFGFYPKAADAADAGDFGWLDIDYTLTFEVVRDPTYVLT